MDKFEQKIQEVMEMSDRDRNNAIEHYKGSCICHTCATYDQCAADANEKLFCVTGKVWNVLLNRKDVSVLYVH
ncbi:DUF2769 domain-containing protein [Methanobacterium spitsbergense]|uniref:DUF2769 domain-containing protein n=1 Tax=Methanobacterium spitsbergense TaxID=2874285 RepID=UPI001CC1A30E|nr:DUF2769 domain-containing protein [Methanobacterium spitsbergense]